MPATATSNGVAIAYEARGAGSPALMFVHGWSCDRGYWSDQLDAFDRDFEVVAVDLAGHGESGAVRKAWTMRSFGEDVAAVAEALALGRVIMIGHSMGGDVIMEAARRLRDSVVGLIWVDTHRSIGPPASARPIQESLAPFRADFVEATRAFARSMFPVNADPALVERVADDMSAAPPEVALPTLEAAWSYGGQVPAMLETLRLPVIAINPDYRPTDTESMARHGIETVIMSRSGHFLMMEKPARFNVLLREAIQRLTG